MTKVCTKLSESLLRSIHWTIYYDYHPYHSWKAGGRAVSKFPLYSRNLCCTEFKGNDGSHFHWLLQRLLMSWWFESRGGKHPKQSLFNSSNMHQKLFSSHINVLKIIFFYPTTQLKWIGLTVPIQSNCIRWYWTKKKSSSVTCWCILLTPLTKCKIPSPHKRSCPRLK